MEMIGLHAHGAKDLGSRGQSLGRSVAAATDGVVQVIEKHLNGCSVVSLPSVGRAALTSALVSIFGAIIVDEIRPSRGEARARSLDVTVAGSFSTCGFVIFIMAPTNNSSATYLIESKLRRTHASQFRDIEIRRYEAPMS